MVHSGPPWFEKQGLIGTIDQPGVEPPAKGQLCRSSRDLDESAAGDSRKFGSKTFRVGRMFKDMHSNDVVGPTVWERKLFTVGNDQWSGSVQLRLSRSLSVVVHVLIDNDV